MGIIGLQLKYAVFNAYSSSDSSTMPGKEYRCDCAKHCKLITGKKVSKSTYFAHANFRKSLSPIPGGFQIGQNPAAQAKEPPGQATSHCRTLSLDIQK